MGYTIEMFINKIRDMNFDGNEVKNLNVKQPVVRSRSKTLLEMVPWRTPI